MWVAGFGVARLPSWHETHSCWMLVWSKAKGTKFRVVWHCVQSLPAGGCEAGLARARLPSWQLMQLRGVPLNWPSM
jgi:hypothetical protein